MSERISVSFSTPYLTRDEIVGTLTHVAHFVRMQCGTNLTRIWVNGKPVEVVIKDEGGDNDERI